MLTSLTTLLVLFVRPLCSACAKRPASTALPPTSGTRSRLCVLAVLVSPARVLWIAVLKTGYCAAD